MKISTLVPFLAVIFISSATAGPVLDISGDEMLRQAADLRLQLNLSAAQASAWLQTEAKTREVLREQKARRERLQIELREQVNGAQFNVGTLASRLDSEDALLQDERRILRLTWISVLKGLNETQERQFREFLRAALDASSMERPAPQSPKDINADDQPRQRSARGGRGGAGIGGGAGGAMPRF